MAKKQIAVTAQSDDGGIATFVYGDAVAIGEDTFTTVDAVSFTVEKTNKTTANGIVKAVAVAEGDTPYASAETEVWVDGADKIKIKTKEKIVEEDGSQIRSRGDEVQGGRSRQQGSAKRR